MNTQTYESWTDTPKTIKYIINSKRDRENERKKKKIKAR